MNNPNDKILIRHIFYSIYGWFLFLTIFFLLYFVFMPIVAIFSLLFFDRNRKAFSYLPKVFIRIFFFLYSVHRLNINSKVLKKPAKGERRIYVINHASQYDVILMNILPGPIKVVVKEKWANKPLIGHLQKLGGNIIIKQAKSTTEALEMFNDAAKKLESGIPVVIFPEGTRSRDGNLQKFYKGTFRLALETQADLVPVVFDSWNSIRPGGLWIRDVRPAIRILPTIKYDEYKHLSHIKLSNVIRSQMMEELLELRDERRTLEKNYYRKAKKFEEIDNKMREELTELKNRLKEKEVALISTKDS